MTRLERLAPRVRAAAADIEANEYPAKNGPYFRLAGCKEGETLGGRIDLAHAIYLYGNSDLRGSRTFDGCFESGDGRQVCEELSRRALIDPVLYAAIAQDFGGTFPAQWLNTREPELAL